MVWEAEKKNAFGVVRVEERELVALEEGKGEVQVWEGFLQESRFRGRERFLVTQSGSTSFC